jgi:ABC-type phosphate/phosphonate transport system substrate-binding protein
VTQRHIFLLLIFLCAFQWAGQIFSAESQQTDHVLDIAIALPAFYDVDLRDAKATFKILGDMLFKKTGLSYTEQASHIFQTNSELLDVIQSSEIEIIVIPPEILINMNDNLDITPVLVASHSDDIFDKFGLLYHRSANFKNLNDVKGKRLVLNKANAIGIPMIWLDAILSKANLPKSEHFFLTIDRTDNAQKSIMDIFFHKADVCLASMTAYETMVILNPQIGKEVQILQVSDPYIFPIVCFGKKLSNTENDRKILYDTLLNMSHDATGQQILKLFGIDHFELFETSYLTAIRKLMDDYHRASKPTK